METILTLLLIAAVIATVGFLLVVVAYVTELDSLMAFAFLLLLISTLLTWAGVIELRKAQMQQAEQERIDVPQKAIVFEGKTYVLEDGK